MTISFGDYLAQRKPLAVQRYDCAGGKGTVMVCSHIWWTEMIAHAVLSLGYNVLVTQPLYLLYTDPATNTNFSVHFDRFLKELKDHDVSLIIAGNTSALAPHMQKRTLLHEMAGVPLVNYWWDEIRTAPPYAAFGFSPDDYLGHLKGPRTLNVIWDIDVLEEMREHFGVTNSVHVPLGTLPEHWPYYHVPLDQRAIDACFLGNCHFAADYVETSTSPVVTWANRVVTNKLGYIRRPMIECIAAAGAPPAPDTTETSDAWSHAFGAWEVLNAVYMHRTRNTMVKAAYEHLRGRLALIGKGWDKIGLRANAAHAETRTGHIYANAKASLNLFGGCVHGGMPLRPFDIAASHGLILTHDTRELPELFEPGRECVAFGSAEELLARLDRVLGAPSEHDAIVTAGHARAFAEHTWVNRLGRVLDAAAARFGVAR